VARDSFSGPPPWLLQAFEQAADTTQPFTERVRAADEAVRLAKRFLTDVIAYGLAVDGHSWTDVGDALGITRQAAFQRFRTQEGGGRS
jgi:hypothetical protein